DDERAAQLYRKACEANAYNACTSYGFMFEKGRGVPHDPVKAVDYYRRGCEGGNAQGCSNMGVMYEEGRGTGTKDLGQAAEFYERACKMGLAKGCENRVGVTATMRANCDRPDAEDCANLGYVYEHGIGASVDPQQAAEYYARSCKAKRPVGCSNLGILYEHGQ